MKIFFRSENRGLEVGEVRYVVCYDDNSAIIFEIVSTIFIEKRVTLYGIDFTKSAYVISENKFVL